MAECPCNCTTTIRDISVENRDLLVSILFLGVVKLSRAQEDARTLIQTDRFQRRELIRNGIPYKEID